VTTGGFFALYEAQGRTGENRPEDRLRFNTLIRVLIAQVVKWSVPEGGAGNAERKKANFETIIRA